MGYLPPHQTWLDDTESRTEYRWFPSSSVAGGRYAFEGKGPQRPPRKRSGRRLEEVAEAVGGGFCRLQMPVSLALAVRETVAGHRLRAVEGAGGGYPPHPPFQCIPGWGDQVLLSGT